MIANGTSDFQNFWRRSKKKLNVSHDFTSNCGWFFDKKCLPKGVMCLSPLTKPPDCNRYNCRNLCSKNYSLSWRINALLWWGPSKLCRTNYPRVVGPLNPYALCRHSRRIYHTRGPQEKGFLSRWVCNQVQFYHNSGSCGI